MMRRTSWIALSAGIALLLSACTISVEPTPPTIGDQVDSEVRASITNGGADLEAEPAVSGSVTLAPGEERVYRVEIPESPQPAFFVYTSAPLDLFLYNGNESLYATSSSPEFFAAGHLGLTAASASGVITPSIVVAQACPGSCIIAENPGEGHAYVKVENDTGSQVRFALYIVLRDFADDNEDLADGEAASFSGDSKGALETIGDEDFFVVDAGGFLNFDATQGSGIGFVAEISDPEFGEHPTRRIRPGESTQVFLGERIRVYGEDTTQRAAVSGNSSYNLYY